MSKPYYCWRCDVWIDDGEPHPEENSDDDKLTDSTEMSASVDALTEEGKT